MTSQTPPELQHTYLTEIEALRDGLARFMAESCASLCLDDDQDRETAAEKIAHWLFHTDSLDANPERILPRARYKLGFNVVDEVSSERIVRLTLSRKSEMTDGDFLQMQNFFWVTIGRAIRDNPEIIKILQAGGIDVETDPGDGAGGQQFAQ